MKIISITAVDNENKEFSIPIALEYTNIDNVILAMAVSQMKIHAELQSLTALVAKGLAENHDADYGNMQAFINSAMVGGMKTAYEGFTSVLELVEQSKQKTRS